MPSNCNNNVLPAASRLLPCPAELVKGQGLGAEEERKLEVGVGGLACCR